MRKIKIYIFVFAVVLIFASSVFAEGSPLFKIERSKNANIVQYDANLNSDGSIDKKNPIDSYWLLYASDGSREEITVFQKKAYGFSVKYNENGYFDMKMKAVEDRALKILLVDGNPKAEIIINGKRAYLTKIYIDSKDNFAGIPKVKYYILTGNDIETGEEITEKIEV